MKRGDGGEEATQRKGNVKCRRRRDGKAPSSDSYVLDERETEVEKEESAMPKKGRQFE